MLPDASVFIRNETLRTIKDRHSGRTFTRNDVNDEEIKVLLHAANAAPVVIAVANTGELIKHGIELFQVEMKVRSLS